MEDGVPAREVGRAIERLPDLLNGDAGLAFRARAMNLDFVLASGRERFYVPVRSGRLEAVIPGSQILRSAAVALPPSRRSGSPTGGRCRPRATTTSSPW